MSETNNYGIPLDPEAAIAAVKAGTIKITEDPGEVSSGPIVELFSITVPNKDKPDEPFYDSKGPNQPFYWVKVDNLPAVLEAEGAELDDAQIELIGSALTGEKTGKAVRALIATYNSVQRANAKQAEYSRISALKKPMDEETKAKRIETTIAFFATMHNVSLDVARQKLVAAGLI
jgi:ribosomal protein L12E/L44/L45/RPP1/RPP2